MIDDEPIVENFLSLAAARQARDQRLSGIQAGLIVAAELNIARDSRTAARLLGLAHALVLRELNALVEQGDTLRVVKKDARTLRLFYELVD